MPLPPFPSVVPCVPPGGHVIRRGPLSAHPIVVYSDGSVKRGRGYAAFAVQDARGDLLHEQAWALPGVTRDSNVPELDALELALAHAQEQGLRSVVCCLDSYEALHAVHRALNGEVTRYAQTLRIVALLASFESVELRNIERRKNRRADALCRSMH